MSKLSEVNISLYCLVGLVSLAMYSTKLNAQEIAPGIFLGNSDFGFITSRTQQDSFFPQVNMMWRGQVSAINIQSNEWIEFERRIKEWKKALPRCAPFWMRNQVKVQDHPGYYAIQVIDCSNFSEHYKRNKFGDLVLKYLLKDTVRAKYIVDTYFWAPVFQIYLDMGTFRSTSSGRTGIFNSAHRKPGRCNLVDNGLVSKETLFEFNSLHDCQDTKLQKPFVKLSIEGPETARNDFFAQFAPDHDLPIIRDKGVINGNEYGGYDPYFKSWDQGSTIGCDGCAALGIDTSNIVLVDARYPQSRYQIMNILFEINLPRPPLLSVGCEQEPEIPIQTYDRAVIWMEKDSLLYECYYFRKHLLGTNILNFLKAHNKTAYEDCYRETIKK